MEQLQCPCAKTEWRRQLLFVKKGTVAGLRPPNETLKIHTDIVEVMKSNVVRDLFMNWYTRKPLKSDDYYTEFLEMK
jgi:hypothetical protein